MTEECFACGEPVHEDEWVIPLKTFRAAYRGSIDERELVLNADETCETLIHADCLRV